MLLTFLGISTGKDGCPTLYSTDRGTYVIQGWRVGAPDLIARMNLGPGETCVETPAHLMTFLLEPHSADADAPRPYVVTDRGTYVVKGPEITDPATLSQMDVPSHETAVEVLRESMADVAREIAWSG